MEIYQRWKFYGQKNQRFQGKMESHEAIISEMKDAIRNTILRVVNTISGCFGDKDDMWNLMGILKLYNLSEGLGNLQKGGGNLENIKNIADFEGGKGIVQLPKGKEQEMRNLQRNIKKLKKDI